MSVYKATKFLSGAAIAAALSLVGTAALAQSTSITSGPNTVVYGKYQDGETLDPHVASAGMFDHLVTSAIFEPLIWDFDASKPESEMRGLRGVLAESWETIDDLTWRLTIRQGIKFHNGEPLNAEAVKFNLERPHQDGFQTGDKIVDVAISHVDIVDEYTVDVVTKEPIPILPERLTRNGAFIVAPEYYSTLSQDEAADVAVGTGPFKLVEWVRDQYVILERNENYWGEAPNFERLVIRIIPEPSTMFAEVMTGNIDIAPINPDLVDEVRAQDGVGVIIGDSLVRAMVGINTTAHDALGDPRVREALNLAIDTDALIDAYALGSATKSVQMVSPPYENPNLEAKGYDPDRARELLAEAGWADGFTIDMDVGHADAQPMSEGIGFYLSQVGVEVSGMSVLSRSVWVERWNAGTLAGLHPYYWSAGENTPETDMWSVHPDRPTNSTNWYNQEWVDAYAEMASSMDQDRREELNNRLQEILHEENPWINLYRIPLVMAVNDRIEGYFPHPSFLVEHYGNIRIVE